MKRSEIKRSKPLLRRDSGEARTNVPVMAKCRVCRNIFQQDRAKQVVCPPPAECAQALVEQRKAKEARIREKAERVADREKRESLKTRGQWLAEAKSAIQRFRRLEELAKGSGCMTCKRSRQEVEGTDGWKPGGAWDGGHFISKGAKPELALEPLNVWLQCKSCNSGSWHHARKGATVSAAFRVNLIKEIGIAKVEWLEGPHEPKKYTIPELKEIRDTYRAKARQLDKS